MDIKIIRSKRRSVALIVTQNEGLVVRAPIKASANYIDSLIRKNFEWINRKIQEIKSKPQIIAKKFVDGENFLYLGKNYQLKIIEDRGVALKFEEGFILNRLLRYKAKDLFTSWYKKEAKKIISQRVRFYSQKTGLKYKKIRITNANSRWGSCSAKNNLNFTWRLIMAPLSIIDYVIVHELSHIEHKNHSDSFWKKVIEILPDYNSPKKWLKKNGYLLRI